MGIPTPGKALLFEPGIDGHRKLEAIRETQ